MLGVLCRWFAYTMSQTVLEKLPFMVFVVVLPWHWLLCKPALVTSFDFFPMVFQPPTIPRTMSTWSKTSSTLPTPYQAEDIVNKVFSSS